MQCGTWEESEVYRWFIFIKFQSPQGGSKLELLTLENVTVYYTVRHNARDEASRTPARRLAGVLTSRAATPAKRRLGLGGQRLGGGPSVQAQSPSKRLRLSQANEETTPKDVKCS